jgi:hypothetical protein
MSLPEFAGWEPLAPEEIVQQGHVFVLVTSKPGPSIDRDPNTSPHVSNGGTWRAAEWKGSPHWPYRRTGQRGYTPHHLFSCPLPLPR